MSNASQANDGNGHMQTPHEFDVLAQNKINQTNGETFHSKNYVHGIWHPSCTVNVHFHGCKNGPVLILSSLNFTTSAWGMKATFLSIDNRI